MRNKLIELINDCRSMEGYGMDLVERQADHLLANGVTIQRWIPVSERLPEVDGRYLAISSVLNVHYIGIFGFSKDLYKVDERDFKKYKQKKKSGFFSNVIGVGFFEERDITYWMPLPEPPKEEV